MKPYQITPEEIHALNRKRAWSAFITSGGVFTATVLYWMSLLPSWMYDAVEKAMKAYQNLPK